VRSRTAGGAAARRGRARRDRGGATARQGEAAIRRAGKETERFHRFAYADLGARDKVNLDIFWLKGDTLDDPDLLPPPDEIAAEIVKSLECARERFRSLWRTDLIDGARFE
jgi:type I restriction enzyme M protein